MHVWVLVRHAKPAGLGEDPDPGLDDTGWSSHSDREEDPPVWCRSTPARWPLPETAELLTQPVLEASRCCRSPRFLRPRSPSPQRMVDRRMADLENCTTTPGGSIDYLNGAGVVDSLLG